MSRVYIRFLSEEDEVKGYYALATQASVESILGEIFSVSTASLPILEREQVKYDFVPEDEVVRVHEKLRAFQQEQRRKGVVSKVRKIKEWALNH